MPTKAETSFLLRCSKAQKARWEKAAKREGVSLRSFLSDAAEARAKGDIPSPAEPPVAAPEMPSATHKDIPESPVEASPEPGGDISEALAPVRRRARERTQMCPHRVPAGSWCKRCDG